MKWLWFPIFLLFAIVEYFNQSPVCGSTTITGQMWFMWLMMSIASSGLYYQRVCKWL